MPGGYYAGPMQELARGLPPPRFSATLAGRGAPRLPGAACAHLCARGCQNDEPADLDCAMLATVPAPDGPLCQGTGRFAAGRAAQRPKRPRLDASEAGRPPDAGPSCAHRRRLCRARSAESAPWLYAQVGQSRKTAACARHRRKPKPAGRVFT